MKLAIVIPAFNEAGRIEATVRSAKPYGTPLVIDDGSTDNTADLAKAAGADVIRLSPNQGYDQALNAGFKAAAERDFDCVITFDADGQHPEQALTRVHQHLKTGCELVVGKRHKKARWSEKLFGLYTRVRFDPDTVIVALNRGLPTLNAGMNITGVSEIDCEKEAATNH